MMVSHEGTKTRRVDVEKRRLKYTATINDESLTEATEPDYELQYIDIGNVDSYGTVHDVVAYKFEDAPSRARRIARHGDVIVSTVRTYLQAVTRGLNPAAPLKPSGLDWLGDIPAHWDVCQLKRTWSSADYGLSDSIRDEGDVTVLRMSCIVDGRIDVSKAGTIEEVDEYLYLRRGDLLFNRTNSLDQIAKVGLIDFDPESPLTFASYLVRIRTNHRASTEYLVHLLNSREFLEYAGKNAIAAIGQANLSPTRYGEIHIPLPGFEEQDSLVGLLNEEAELSSPLRKDIQGSIELLKERRATLITAAVTGLIPVEEMRA